MFTEDENRHYPDGRIARVRIRKYIRIGDGFPLTVIGGLKNPRLQEKAVN